MSLRHVLSASQFDRPTIDALFASADRMRATVGNKQAPHFLHGKKVGLVFCEDSTRTVGSFQEAAELLGARVHLIDLRKSSTNKGESIENTVRTLERLRFDVLVIRHPDAEFVRRAAAVATIPIINAGNGADEHPSQALLDLYTILKCMPKRDELVMAVCGDLKYGRAVRSLLRLMMLYWDGCYCPFGLVLCCHESLQPNQDLLDELDKSSIAHMMLCELSEEVLERADVVYMTRVQKERMLPGATQADPMRLDTASVGHLRSDTSILHPMPWVDEIASEVESDPRLRAFDQVENGVFVRMALLAWCLQSNPDLSPPQP